MQKAIVIVPSGVELDPAADPEITKVAGSIVAHTVIVRTPECVGEDVAIAGVIITSLFLVRNHRMVGIKLPSSDETQAVVSSRDERLLALPAEAVMNFAETK